MAVFLQILKSVIFGIVEGITEWLPISSTGHLILLNAVMPLTNNLDFWSMYKYVIQLGAILAVIVLYWHKLWPFSKKKDAREKKIIFHTWFKIFMASIPTALIGIMLNDFADKHLSTPTVVAIMLVVYGILFIVLEMYPRKASIRSIQSLDNMTAIKIGLFQALAVVPGTSRSGATILGALTLSLSRGMAAEFSFFLAVPVMFGISLLELIKHVAAISVVEFIVLAVGMIVSFIVSILVIRSLMHYIRRHDFRVFGIYRIILGILIFVLSLMHVLPNGISA